MKWRKMSKIILVSTSFAPLLIIIGACYLNVWTYVLFGLAAVLIGLCWLMMEDSANTAEPYLLRIKEFNRTDQGIHTFLVIYLLPIIPIIRSPIPITTDWHTFVCIGLTILFLVFTMVRIGAYNFNPVMSAFGYYFYEIKDARNVHHLLITKTVLRKPKEVYVQKLSHDVHVEVEGNRGV